MSSTIGILPRKKPPGGIPSWRPVISTTVISRDKAIDVLDEGRGCAAMTREGEDDTSCTIDLPAV